MKKRPTRFALSLVVWAASLLASPTVFAQTDRIYFPAVDNVRTVLVSKIDAETVRIDMSAWYLTEHAVSIALANAFHRGVQVRLIGDRGAIFEIDAKTRNEFYWLASQGLPIRLRYNPTWFPEIDHMKMTVFKGQNLVSFGSANYTPNQLAPASSTDYSDETVMFSTDPALVDAFLTRFDSIWNDTTIEPESKISGPPYLRNWNDACRAEAACADYSTLYPNPAPMNINTGRLEPTYPTPPDLIWGQGPEFNDRIVQEIDNESASIRLVAYRLTVDNVTQALLGRFQAGVPTRIIIDPSEYSNRKWPEFWLTRANIDKLWAAGVPIKQRQHAGLTHMKLLVTSSYATNASSNFAAAWQRDNDYFVSAATKPTIYQAMANRFDTMWNDAVGFVTFTPLPPDAPSLATPVAGASGVSATPRLTWNAAPFATSYDVYLGTSAGALSLVANVPAQLVANPPSTYSWTVSRALAGGTRYYWRVVARTNASVRDPSLGAASSTWSFVPGGTGGGGVAPDPPAVNPAVIGTNFDGDAKKDITVWRPSTGVWYSLKSSDAYSYATYQAIQWGYPTDVPVPGDYDGDGRTDIAAWRPSTGMWYILESSNDYSRTACLAVQWGLPGDIPVPGDYDGDGKTDIAVWRPSNGTWYILLSSANYSPARSRAIQWGIPSDVPVKGDFDGDGKADIAVWRPSNGNWYILKSSQNYSYSTYQAIQWGLPTDVPEPGDYDGDRKTDIAVWRPSTGTWYVLKSSQGYSYSTYFAVQWGYPTDVPVPGDYDGDGKTDIAVWRPSTGMWFILRSRDGYSYSTYQGVVWGFPTDIPLR